VEGGEDVVLSIGLCIEAERSSLTPTMCDALGVKVYIRHIY
jgi:hypothetical protein